MKSEVKLIATVLMVNFDRTTCEQRERASDGRLLDVTCYDEVARVKFYQETAPREIAEALFEQFNTGDRGGLKCRSLSTGDVVVVVPLLEDTDPTGLVCASVDWHKAEVVRNGWYSHFAYTPDRAPLVECARMAEADRWIESREWDITCDELSL